MIAEVMDYVIVDPIEYYRSKRTHDDVLESHLENESLQSLIQLWPATDAEKKAVIIREIKEMGVEL